MHFLGTKFGKTVPWASHPSAIKMHLSNATCLYPNSIAPRKPVAQTRMAKARTSPAQPALQISFTDRICPCLAPNPSNQTGIKRFSKVCVQHRLGVDFPQVSIFKWETKFYLTTVHERD
jgi:hypothetical protein